MASRLLVTNAAVLSVGLFTLAGCTSFPRPGLPPEPPKALRVECTTGAVVGLLWDAPNSGTGASYVITRNGERLGATTQTYLSDSMVTPQTTYHYAISTV